MGKRSDNFKGSPGIRITTQTARELGAKGGKASAEARRKRQNMERLAAKMLDSALTGPAKAQVQKLCDIEDEDATVAAMMMAGQIKSAAQGNTKAFTALMDLHEKAVERDKADAVYRLPADVIGEAFVKINRHIEPNKDYIFKGGRGSLKSSYLSLKVIEILKNNPDLHACIVRKVGNTLRDSVYAQLKWAINILGLTADFEFKVSPLDIIYSKTGQHIYFRGADDPIKLKSIKPEFGYIGLLWIEERDQIAGPTEERSIKQSVLRGGMLSYFMASYNPPKSKSNWVNKELQQADANRVVHHSTYLTADEEWLGTKFITEAEHLKAVNPDAYAHEYLGEANGDGGNVFDNIEVREITDEEIAELDTIYQGVDWGLNPDPFVFVRLAYDAEREVIYFIDEITGRHLSNAESGQRIIDAGYDDFVITCDSAEKKSVNDYRDLGLPATPAIKGPGSIEYGMKWLMHRKIVIDPARTPVVYKEFTNYEYDRDKDGNVISGYPDKNNHTIDATRYALEKHCNRRGSSA